MRRFFFIVVAVILIGISNVVAQTLSLIDDSLPPSVDVIHDASWQSRDNEHEWNIKMLPETQGFKVEEGLSKLWNEYDARIYWRIQTDINGLSSLVNCTIGLTNFDFTLGAWDSNFFATMPANLFCDGLGLQFPSYIEGICGLGDGTLWTDWERIGRNYANAIAHGLTNYYPDYWKRALALVGTNIPTALNWGFPGIATPGHPTGVTIQPVFGPPQPQMYLELAQRAQQQDLRGAAYIMQRYPLNVLPREALVQVLRWLPGDQIDPTRPGLEKLEDLKRGLTTREGIFDRTLQWASFRFFGGGPQPQGLTGASTPIEEAGVGHQVFFNVISRFATEVSPRVPMLWRSCFDLSSGLSIPFPLPLPPVVHAIPRVETMWTSVPEGRSIPGVQGKPFGYAALFAGLDAIK